MSDLENVEIYGEVVEILNINGHRTSISARLDFDELNTDVCDEIDDFFHEQRDSVPLPLLKILNKVEKITYDYIRKNGKTNHGQVFKEVYEYCYYFHNSSFEHVQEHSFKSFYRHIKRYRKSLPVSALIIINEVGEFLCVVEEYQGKKVLNFPMGKLDFDDNLDLQLTAFRECKEETGIKLTYADKQNSKKYVEFLHEYDENCRARLFRFYILENFEKSRVTNINYKRDDETNGLAWVSPKDFCTFGRNEINVKVLNPTSDLPQDTYQASDFVGFWVAASRRVYGCQNPFKTIGTRNYIDSLCCSFLVVMFWKCLQVLLLMVEISLVVAFLFA